jgi:photosynthetic reaction center H subunit
MMLHGGPRIVPLRLAETYFVDPKSPDPRGMTVVGADGAAAGVVTDVWVDRSEYLIRYLEISVTAAPGTVSPGPRHVLAPMTMAQVRRSRGTVRINALLGSQIAGAPVLENPDQVTLFEEEKICAYFGAGFLYATEQRAEPWL